MRAAKHGFGKAQHALVSILARLPKEEGGLEPTGVQKMVKELNQHPEVYGIPSSPSGTLKDLCVVCGRNATKTCTRCKKARYCSRHCQKYHWKKHKAQCKPCA